MDIGTTTDIPTEICTCLAEAKSHCLTCMLICEATQTGKCWDEIMGILRLKLCNGNIHTYTSHFMEIKQKDNETLAAYIHHFKTAAKQCSFDNETVAIHILDKGLTDAPTITSKIYEKDPQTLAKVIRLVEKLSEVHHLTVTLTPSTVSMMSGDNRCLSVDEQVILATTALMPSVMAVMNLAILPRTALTRFLHQECHATIADLIQGIDIPTTGGTDHTPVMAPDIGDSSAGHSPTCVPL